MTMADRPRQQLPRDRIRLGAIAELLAVALPLIGLVSLLLRSQLDPHLENYRLHFVLFGLAGTLAFVLGYGAGEAAKRRGDARVLLLSLAFMATGGFMGLHALGTPGVLFSADHAGFKVAIPIGLLVSATFAAGSAFVDVRPSFAPVVIRHQTILRTGILLAMGAWFAWTVANLPPLDGPHSEDTCSRDWRSWERSSTRPVPRGTGRSSAHGRTCSRPLSSPASCSSPRR